MIAWYGLNDPSFDASVRVPDAEDPRANLEGVLRVVVTKRPDANEVPKKMDQIVGLLLGQVHATVLNIASIHVDVYPEPNAILSG